MLIPVAEAFENQADIASTKVTAARTSMRQLLGAAALAGAAVGAAAITFLMVSAPLLAAQHPVTRLVQALVFGVGLAIVIFAGAELSTGTVATQLQGFLARKLELADAALVFLAVLIGNLVGSVALAVVVDGAGLFTTHGAHQPPTFQSALGAVAVGVGDLSGGQLLLRSVLCNLLVSAAVFTAARTASDGLRLLVVGAAVLAFVAAGLEYSVLAMTTLSLAALADVGTWGDLSRNLTITVPGNLIGGALFVLLAHGARRAAGEPTGDVGSPAVLPVPEPVAAEVPDPTTTTPTAAAPSVEEVPPTTRSATTTAPKKAPVKKAPAKKAGKKAPAKKAPAKKAPAPERARGGRARS